MCPADSSFALKFKMAGDEYSAMNFILHLIKQNRRRQILIHSFIHQLIRTRRRLLNVSVLVMIISVIRSTTVTRETRTCRRLGGNAGWWENVWDTHIDARLKKNLQGCTTITYIVNRIKHLLERKKSAEHPIAPALRLDLCFCRLGRADCYYTVAKIVGIGVSTVSSIVQEVCQALIEQLWTDTISLHMPKTEEEFRKSQIWRNSSNFLVAVPLLMVATFL